LQFAQGLTGKTYGLLFKGGLYILLPRPPVNPRKQEKATKQLIFQDFFAEIRFRIKKAA
jgi:hypothetical protein